MAKVIKFEDEVSGRYCQYEGKPGIYISGEAEDGTQYYIVYPFMFHQPLQIYAGVPLTIRLDSDGQLVVFDAMPEALLISDYTVSVKREGEWTIRFEADVDPTFPYRSPLERGEVVDSHVTSLIYWLVVDKENWLGILKWDKRPGIQAIYDYMFAAHPLLGEAAPGEGE